MFAALHVFHNTITIVLQYLTVSAELVTVAVISWYCFTVVTRSVLITLSVSSFRRPISQVCHVLACLLLCSPDPPYYYSLVYCVSTGAMFPVCWMCYIAFIRLSRLRPFSRRMHIDVNCASKGRAQRHSSAVLCYSAGAAVVCVG